MKQIVLAVTGASGAVYAQGVATALVAAGAHVHLIVSDCGRRLVAEELHLTDPAGLAAGAGEALTVHPCDDLGDPLASGSTATDGMVICPASVNTVAAVAAGLADTLIRRAAGIHLRHRRPLVVVPREMPLGTIDLENLTRLSRAGAVIAPASPGFYLAPTSIDDLVQFVTGRILDLLAIDHDLPVRYRPGEA